MSNIEKRVAFVEPRGAPSNVFAKFMTIPLLGPVVLATIAKKAGYDAYVLNENILKRDISNDELKSIDILCMSCITATVNRGKDIAKRYKSIRGNLESRTIIGGIHASMMPEDVKNDFDQVFVGEAETKIVDLLEGKLKDKIVYGEKLLDMDSMPIPDFSLIKGLNKLKIRPLMSSRGCPHDCNFCSVAEMFGRKYRFQSPERVLEELMAYDKGNVFFADDNFAANPKHTEELLDLMLKSGYKGAWSAQVRAQIAKKPELVAKMKKAGCEIVFIGFESVNPKSLIEINKGQTVEDIENAIKVFKKNGISVHGMYIIGTDSDTKSEFKTISKFNRKNKVDYVQYNLLTPLPGTPLYRDFDAQGRIFDKNWAHYDSTHVVFTPKNMTVNELQYGMLKCYTDFYSYRNALNAAIGITFETGITSLKKLFTKAHMPAYHPIFMKFAGKHIVKSWLRKNREYLRNLKVYSKPNYERM